MIAAIILAAGASRRMGRPKMALEWGNTTVLGQVIRVARAAGLADILVVTGAIRQTVEAISLAEYARIAYNKNHARGQMLASLQVGLSAMLPETQAAMIFLGDQPQIDGLCVRQVAERFIESGAKLVVPSHKMRRGHPWLIGRELWHEIHSMREPATPRDFLNTHTEQIVYVDVDTSTILEDIDTPADYQKFGPSSGRP